MKIYSCYQDFFVCTKSSGWPWGWHMPELWAMQNLLMLHPPDWKPTVAQGVHGSTWNWLMHSNQSKRPWKTVENKRFHCHRLSANSQKCNFTHHHLITHTNHNYNKIVKCDWLSTSKWFRKNCYHNGSTKWKYTAAIKIFLCVPKARGGPGVGTCPNSGPCKIC